MLLDDYIFTENWNKNVSQYWKHIISENNYTKLLEIGTFEGNSISYFLDFGIKEIVCIDSWHMKQSQKNFLHNKNIFLKKYNSKIKVMRGKSWINLGKILKVKRKLFDLVYIDGSHYSHNTLIDGCMAFRLLRVGGCIIFDDYNWIRKTNPDLKLSPRLAIDCFENIHSRFIEPVKVHERQKAWYKIDEMEDY